MDEPPLFNTRLENARFRHGLTPHEAAKRANLSSPEYYDLEDLAEEHCAVYSLLELLPVARAVETPLSDLLGIPPQTQSIAAQTVVGRLKAAHKESGKSLDEFAQQVGWELKPLMRDPRQLYTYYSLDGVKDICSAAGVDWQGVIKSMEDSQANSWWQKFRSIFKRRLGAYVVAVIGLLAIYPTWVLGRVLLNESHYFERNSLERLLLITSPVVKAVAEQHSNASFYYTGGDGNKPPAQGIILHFAEHPSDEIDQFIQLSTLHDLCTADTLERYSRGEGEDVECRGRQGSMSLSVTKKDENWELFFVHHYLINSG